MGSDAMTQDPAPAGSARALPARDLDVLLSTLAAARVLLRNGDHADASFELDKATDQAKTLLALLFARLAIVEQEKASDAWHQGWKVAVQERDEARHAIHHAASEALESTKRAAKAEAALTHQQAALAVLEQEMRQEAGSTTSNIREHVLNECADRLAALRAEKE